MDKNKVLAELAVLLFENRFEIIERNKKDLILAAGIDPTLIDRLKVDEHKVQLMVDAIDQVIALEDPEFKLITEYVHPNGMLVQNRVVPFGNILIIYESRPDVTIEAAISAFKAGNKIYLKGGKEAKLTNLYLVSLWHQALEKHGISKGHVNYLDIDRTETQRVIKENPHAIDLIIPRGGAGLINYIKSNTSIPLIISGRGNNFVYVHKDANLEMAIKIILNGKSRLSVCNAIDKVIVDTRIPDFKSQLVTLISVLKENNIELISSQAIHSIAPEIKEENGEEVKYEEFLAAKLWLDSVDSVSEAVKRINTYSGGHSAVIVTEDKEVGLRFQREVDCAAVYHNASSRFTDGGQFGMGSEIAISTQKLHFRGPVGMAQLVSNKWFISGTGQVR